MSLFRSYRTKLLASTLVLVLLAIVATDWQASVGSTAALREATCDRLTAIRETKRQLVEGYFNGLVDHVLALSADESTIAALERFRDAWGSLPHVMPGDAAYGTLLAHYRTTFAPAVAHQMAAAQVIAEWFPHDARARGLQHLLITGNPHPVVSRDLLLEPANGGEYGRAHVRFHPTLHRYRDAFGLYDIFLIDAQEGRVLYTVAKEIDLGATLGVPPYRHTALARAYRRAMSVDAPEQAVIEDYAHYVASHFAPAAFVAAPIWRAGSKIGVLVAQVSIQHVNRVMTGDRRWQEQGLGRTGQTYIVAADRTLRSDVRFAIEQPDTFLSQLRAAGVPPRTIDHVRRDGTAILNLALPARVADRLRTGQPGTEIGTDLRNVPVIRSHAPLHLPGLAWTLVAEMETEEAFGPAAALRRRLLVAGLGIAATLVLAAWTLGRSVTRPVMALVEGTRRLGKRDFHVRLPVASHDEIGQLAASFNQMAERLEHTTVSRDALDQANRELSLKGSELASLNARLIRAQEEERSRLARELHDDLTQRIAAVAIAAGALKRSAPAQDGTLPQGLAEIQRQLVALSNDVHGLSRRLHSSTLEDLGLVAAIEGECRGFFERGGPPVELTHSGSFDSLNKDAQLALYRIVQEALRNIFRHADAGEVTIRLQREADAVTLEIEDNGRGFDEHSPEWRPGLGLASMRERARLLGGDVTVRSRSGGGTVVSALVPAQGAA